MGATHAKYKAPSERSLDLLFSSQAHRRTIPQKQLHDGGAPQPRLSDGFPEGQEEYDDIKYQESCPTEC
jgi:hypothetical protein